MILFQPNGKSYINGEKETIMESARKAGISIENSCGATGLCGKCKIQVVVGETNPVTEEEKQVFSKEELDNGWRLACQCIPKNLFQTLEVYVPEKKSTEKIRWAVSAGEDWETIEWKFPDLQKEDGKKYGIAVDIGTTNIEAVLWDFEKGSCKGYVVSENEQKKYGMDVISRITYTIGKKDSFHELCECLQEQVAKLIKVLCAHAKIEDIEDKIAGIDIVGNSVMMHFLAEQSVEVFQKAPYEIVFRGGCRIEKKMDEKIAPWMLVPNIESFVGADTLGVLYYLENTSKIKYRKEETYLAIDIGTNGELALQKNGKWYVCSTAAGPAFEGASISCGMRAGIGAIKGIKNRGDKAGDARCEKKESFHRKETRGRKNTLWELESVEVSVIGDGEPAGICGSGLIELIALVLDSKLAEESGYIYTREEAIRNGCNPCVAACIEEGQQGNQIRLFESKEQSLYLTQKDIREVQVAKAAIATGIQCLLENCQVKEEEISSLYLAGAFGSYLSIEAANRIGLLPKLQQGKIQPIGNASLKGAVLMLAKNETLAELEKYGKEVRHISLVENPDFQNRYLSNMLFK